MPLISDDGAHARSRTCARPTTRIAGCVAVDPETGKTRVVDTLHDDAWVREAGGFGPNDRRSASCPTASTLWFLSERDGWMHLYTLDASGGAARPRAS